MNVNLKIALVRSGNSQRDIARLGGFSERRLSDIITGWAEVREQEKQVLARLLGVAAEALFEDADAHERASGPMHTRRGVQSRSSLISGSSTTPDAGAAEPSSAVATLELPQCLPARASEPAGGRQRRRWRFDPVHATSAETVE